MGRLYLLMQKVTIPLEGVGTSGNPNSGLAAPRFEDASFKLEPGKKFTTKVNLRYWIRI